MAKAAEATQSLKAESQSSSQIDAIELDITNDDSIAKAVQSISQKTDHLDVLVNNAGKFTIHRIASFV